jgi:sulfatase modifying factor 1
MSRPVLLAVVACGAFAATFGVVKFVDYRSAPAGMAWVPGGEFTMGSDGPDASAAERPAHRVRVDGFWMDETDVTNAQFLRFVEATGYVTTAEKVPTVEDIQRYAMPGATIPKQEDLKAGALVFSPPDHPVDLRDVSQWWKWTPGADWRHPEGPGSSIDGRQATADGGRVGVRRPRWAGRQEVRLGRRAVRRRAPAVQQLPGPFP